MNQMPYGAEFPPTQKNVNEVTDFKLLDDFPVPSKIQIRQSELSGYGVFATEFIPEGEVVEVCAYAQMNHRSKEKILDPVIRQLLYTVPCGCETCKAAGRHFAIITGNASLYNHGSEEERNVNMKWDHSSRTVQFIAVKDINKDDELLNYYGPQYTEEMLNQSVGGRYGK